MHLFQCLGFVVIVLALEVSSSEITDYNDGLTVKDIVLEMQNAIKHLNLRIKNLETSENRLLLEQKNSKQHIEALELRLSKIQHDLKNCQRIDQSKQPVDGFFENGDPLRKFNNASKERGSLSAIRKERLLIPMPTPTPATTISEVAFFAYMSQPLTNPSGEYVIKFDVLKINVGNAYHPHTGVFNPPTSGIYVMAWSLRSRITERHSTELVVNSDVYSSMYSYSHNDDDQHNTGIVVVHANKGDDIYVRIKMDKHVGDIWSDAYGRSTLAGWKIY
ncbi:uncharacterized protein LOC134709562 [Mytilus trossulus]|uniref:uncharacterized protein LOC134709562 n=1 Tax=Mytilus trossulus TaxID=6551 RepID=UPI0030065E67